MLLQNEETVQAGQAKPAISPEVAGTMHKPGTNARLCFLTLPGKTVRGGNLFFLTVFLFKVFHKSKQVLNSIKTCCIVN